MKSHGSTKHGGHADRKKTSLVQTHFKAIIKAHHSTVGEVPAYIRTDQKQTRKL